MGAARANHPSSERANGEQAHEPEQLALIEAPPDWRLDEATRELGRRGVAEARRRLAAARPTGRAA
jgi:hypothetical protein